MELFSIMRWLHIIGGFVSLFTFWIPIVTKKGGKAHSSSGWIYVLGMLVVSVSAFYMGMSRLIDPNSSKDVVSFSLFLIFIALLSFATAYYGLRVLKYKNRATRHKKVHDLAIPFILLIFAIGISIYGFNISSSLIAVFPLIGIFLGATQLYYWLQKPKRQMHWLFEHLSGMIGCSIATITAFVVFGAPRLLQIDSANVLLWFLPTMLLTPVIIGFTIYYKKKFAAKDRYWSMSNSFRK